MLPTQFSHRVFSVVFLLLICCGALVGFQFIPLHADKVTDQVTPIPAQLPTIPVEQAYPHVLGKATTLYSSLRSLSVDAQTIHQIVEATKPVMDLGRLGVGTRFRITYGAEAADLNSIDFHFSAVDKLSVSKVNGIWSAQKITEKVDTKVVSFQGVVSSSLWESAESAGMDPYLVVQLAEIFAWQVDFAREVRLNDRWRLAVEQKFVKGEPIGWGPILAANYENAGQLHRAVYFCQDGQPEGYYAPDGSSLKRMFLKSPIQYGRISSRFTRKRFHPVLKINRPHLGVDYAAPTGTPIRAVGSGVVTRASWHGGGGRTVQIRHNSIYKTSYLHLSRFATGLRAGQRVNQGQIIGFVGSSGMSTGPHLHFEFSHNGRVVDPLGQKFPAADPVPSSLMAQFQNQSATYIKELPQWEVDLPPTTAVSSSSTLPPTED